MKKIKVGVIGVGHLGAIHAHIYKNLPEAELVAVSDINSRRLWEISNKLRVQGYANYKKLLNQVDAVSIAVPTSLHYQIAQYCLKRNISTLIEKPFTRSLGQANKLIKLAKQKQLVLQVGHIERFNSAFVAT